MARGAPDYSTAITQFLGESYKLGAGQDVDPTKIVGIWTQANASRYQTFERLGTADGSVGSEFYQVPVGKLFVCLLMLWAATVAGASAFVGQADGTKTASLTPPTGGLSLVPEAVIATEVASKQYSLDIILRFTAGKYPYMRAAGGNMNMMLIGIER